MGCSRPARSWNRPGRSRWARIASPTAKSAWSCSHVATGDGSSAGSPIDSAAPGGLAKRPLLWCTLRAPQRAGRRLLQDDDGPTRPGRLGQGQEPPDGETPRPGNEDRRQKADQREVILKATLVEKE